MCSLFFERFVLFFCLKIERFVPDSAEIWICGLYFPDMVFYHTKLKCYVVLELKVVEFEPEFAGKLNFYVSAADHLLKDDNDNPSIGLLVCKSKNETVVKWAFEGIDRPLGVATYELDEVLKKTLAEKLPSIEDIENAIEE